MHAAHDRDPGPAHRPARSSRSRADIDRDFILRGADAVAYGVVDHVIDRRRLVPGPLETLVPDGVPAGNGAGATNGHPAP